MILPTTLLLALPPFHSWTVLTRWEGERDPTSTVIVCNLPHLGASVFVRYGSTLPEPAMQTTDPIGYSIAYAIAAKQNDAIVSALDADVQCPPAPPSPSVNIDLDGSGMIDSNDFMTFIRLWSEQSNNGIQTR